MDISLIYLLLAVNLTVAEANSTADRLGLSHAKISDLAQVQDFPILPPRDEVNNIYRGLYAGVRTTNFNFAFGQDIIGLTQLCGPAGVEDWKDDDGQIGVSPGSVTKEMAYQQARTWLEKMGVDVVAMEKKHSPRVEHQELPLTNRKTVSSRFIVKWGAVSRPGLKPGPVAEVGVNASQNWLVRLDINDLTFYRYPVPNIPHAIAVNLLPDSPVRKYFHVRPKDSPQRIFTDFRDRYTNAFLLLKKSAAYETEGRRRLQAEARQILSILRCDQLDEPDEKNLTDLYVNPPAFGAGGRLEFTNGEMQFDPDGKLRFFRFLPRGHTNYYVWLASKQSLISTDEAYQIATQKLAALSIDLEQLNHAFKQTFSQRQFYRFDDQQKRIWFYTPEYELTWSDASNSSKPPVAKVVVYGDVKQIGRIELQDTAYWRRPPVVVTNADELMQQHR